MAVTMTTTTMDTWFPEFHIVVGPMYSGKTRKLQEIMYRNAVAGPGLVVNHSNDEVRQAVEESGGGSTTDATRGPVRPGHARSHDGKRCPAVFVARLVPEVTSLPEYAAAAWVGVDEAQFFAWDDVCAFVARSRYMDRKNLVMAGLHADDRGVCFMDFNSLLPQCTSFKLLSARCQEPGCLAAAHHTYAAFDKRSKVDFEHTDEYRAVCDYHFLSAKSRVDRCLESNDRRPARSTETTIVYEVMLNDSEDDGEDEIENKNENENGNAGKECTPPTATQ